MRRKTSDVEAIQKRLDGKLSSTSSPGRIDTQNYDSGGEYSPSRRDTEGDAIVKDPKNITKFTIDTQSTYEKKKIVANPNYQQEEPH